MPNPWSLERMRRLLPLLLVLLWAWWPCVPIHAGEPAYSPEDVLSFADELYAEEKYILALVEYERFLTRFPNHPDVPKARKGKAYCLFQTGSYDAALSEFRTLAAEYPDSEGRDAALEAARCYVLLGRPEVSVEVLDRLVRRRPDTEEAQHAAWDLAWVHLKAYRWHDAGEALKEIRSNPPYGEAAELLEGGLKSRPVEPVKSPELAGVLSGVLPGAGQAYCGKWKDAGLALLLNGLFVFGAYEAFDHDLYVIGGGLALIELGFYGGNIYNAVNHAHKINRTRDDAFLRGLVENSRLQLVLPRNDRRWLGLLMNVSF